MSARAGCMLLTLVLVVGACSGKDHAGHAHGDAGHGAPPSGAIPSPAKPAVTQPGALCEHKVLAAICPKCNPRLATVFQTSGDWCAEHGFPESVCPICHPEREGRPTGKVDGAEAPADGTKVKLKTAHTAELAGMLTQKAEERPGGARLIALATIAYDATKRAEVNARAPGVVRALRADVGAKVASGASLAVIDSAAVGSDRSRLGGAGARMRIAEANLRREKELHEKGIASYKAVLSAQSEWESARAEYSGAAAALGVVGRREQGAGSYVLAAPIAGIVTRRHATIGHMVDVEEVLFEIVDTSSMWAEIDIPETDLGLVAPGQSVTLTVDGLPGRTFEGTIDYVVPEVDPRTRTVKARLALPNQDGSLRAHMFATARIALGSTKVAVLIPRAAVHTIAGVSLCFVRVGPAEFEVRRIETGAVEGQLIEVKRGIKPNEEVATQGSFLLKTETLGGSIGAGCCE